MSWTRDDKVVASISLRAEKDRLDLSYRVQISGGEWEDVAETVRIVRVRCRYGGARPYFICPGVVDGVACRRRVAKLYVGGRYFLCRHCYRLRYACQSEDELDRARRRADKLTRRLGPSSRSGSEFPDRPRGMWRRTYDRLRAEAIEAEMVADEIFCVRAHALIGRIDGRHQSRRFWS